MDVKLPKLGEGADSGVVVNIFVKEGDTVAKDQAILELENEKAVASIPSTAAGVVTKIYVKPGEKVTVGQRLLSLSGGEPAPAATPAPAVKMAEASRQPAAVEDDQSSLRYAPARDEEEEEHVSTVARVAVPVASPSLRKLVCELGIDLSRVRGSEAGGRIGIGDIRAYIARLQKAADKPKPAATGAAPAKPVAEPVDFSQWGPVTKKPVTPLRQVIARRMWENWNAIPHVTQLDDADFTRLNELRKKYAAAYEQKGAKLTFMPFVLKALVATLKKTSDFQFQPRRGGQ